MLTAIESDYADSAHTARGGQSASRRGHKALGIRWYFTTLRHMRWLSLLVLAALACAVDVAATVTRVSDGDTIAVGLADGVGATIRLLYIDTAESHNNSHGAAMAEGVAAATFLRDLLPIGAAVTLHGPGTTLEKDRYGRLLAIVALPDGGSAQEKLIAAGWSVYWRKYGEAENAYQVLFLAAHAAAKATGVGAWGTVPDWMHDKSNERTAPKK